MASMAAAGPTKRGSSWNPFRCGGTVLPPHVLLAAKLIAVFLLARYAARYGGEYGVAFGPLSLEFAQWLPGVRLTAQGVAVASALLLLFNRGVRWMSLAMGICIAFEFALHWLDYNELFVGAFLLLAASQRNGREPVLLRYWVVVIYLAVGLSWLFGPGSALLFDVFARREQTAVIAPKELYLALEPALSPGLLPRITDWAVALASIAIAAGFLVRRLYPLAIWVALALHCAWGFIAGPFEGLSFAILACYLVFVAWPQEPLAVFYDGECGFCNRTREWISKVDFDRLYQWLPFQSGAGATYGISEKALEEKVHVVAGDRIYTGFRAFRAMALYNPASYLTAGVLLATLGLWRPSVRDWLFAALVLLFSPLCYPVGEAAYDWVARNRYRLPPRTCKAPE